MPKEVLDAIVAEAGEFSVGDAEALDVWRFMGSEWRPEVLPIVLAVFPVDDVDMLLARLWTIRSVVEEQRQQQ